MSEERFLQSKTFRGMLFALGAAAAAMLVFAGGMVIGARKASFACKWGENYYHNFAEGDGRRLRGGGRGWFRSGPGRPEMSGHGAAGQIISIKDGAVAVKGRDGVERNIIVNGDTDIRRERDTIGLADLAVGDQVMAFGSPDDSGSIVARLIRVFGDWPPSPR